MKSTIQNRGARCITAALLESTLSERELDEIANEFLHSGDMSQQIGKTIKEFLSGSISSGISKTPSPKVEIRATGHPMADEAVAIIKKKRLSKVSIIKKMGIVAPKALEFFMGRIDMPVEAMLIEFFKNEPREKGFAFLELLDGPASRDDEYLKGIMREKR